MPSFCAPIEQRFVSRFVVGASATHIELFAFAKSAVRDMREVLDKPCSDVACESDQRTYLPPRIKQCMCDFALHNILRN
jgi:hypothetical protein